MAKKRAEEASSPLLTRRAANTNAEKIVVTDQPRLLYAFSAQFEEPWVKYVTR